jgi:hypothetical protein
MIETTTEQKKHMVVNLHKAFELLNTVLELKLAYLKKKHPGKTDEELKRKILIDAIKAKERQWK